MFWEDADGSGDGAIDVSESAERVAEVSDLGDFISED